MSAKYRTIKQVAQERPWVTERYLRRLVFERRIPYTKATRGGKVLIDINALDALVESNRVEPRRPR